MHIAANEYKTLFAWHPTADIPARAASMYNTRVIQCEQDGQMMYRAVAPSEVNGNLGWNDVEDELFGKGDK